MSVNERRIDLLDAVASVSVLRNACMVSLARLSSNSNR